MTIQTGKQNRQSSLTVASRPMVVAWGYLLFITVAEIVTVLVDPIAGAACHSVLLVVILAHSALVEDTGMRRIILPLALAPLTRILSITMPLSAVRQIYWYPIIYLPLAVCAFVIMRQLRMGRREIGLTRSKPFWQMLAIPLGVLLGLVEYMILRPEPLESALTVQTITVSIIIFTATTGFVEELVFRGVLQKVMNDRFGWLGILYVSILFAVLHLGFLSAGDMGFVFVVAILFAWIAKATGSLAGVTLAHGLTNARLYVIFPLLLKWH